MPITKSMPRNVEVMLILTAKDLMDDDQDDSDKGDDDSRPIEMTAYD